MRIHEHIFENQDVVLDFHEYDHCTFNRCRLKVYGFGAFRLTNNTITNCRWEFAGPAAATIQVMTMLYSQGQSGRDLVENTFASIRQGRPPAEGKK